MKTGRMVGIETMRPVLHKAQIVNKKDKRYTINYKKFYEQNKMII